MLGSDDMLTIVCLQEFDECDYIQSKFLTNSEGDQLVFDECMCDEDDNEVKGKDIAKEWLNENIKAEHIDFEYRLPNGFAKYYK